MERHEAFMCAQQVSRPVAKEAQATFMRTAECCCSSTPFPHGFRDIGQHGSIEQMIRDL